MAADSNPAGTMVQTVSFAALAGAKGARKSDFAQRVGEEGRPHQRAIRLISVQARRSRRGGALNSRAMTKSRSPGAKRSSLAAMGFLTDLQNSLPEHRGRGLRQMDQRPRRNA